jgi:hypothetical protein
MCKSKAWSMIREEGEEGVKQWVSIITLDSSTKTGWSREKKTVVTIRSHYIIISKTIASDPMHSYCTKIIIADREAAEGCQTHYLPLHRALGETFALMIIECCTIRRGLKCKRSLIIWYHKGTTSRDREASKITDRGYIAHSISEEGQVQS